MGRSNVAGLWGELIAGKYLMKRRYKVVDVNYRCKFGEIDLIVADRKHLIFVEVKLRKSASFAAAAEFVDYHKQARLKATAELYLSQNPTDLQPRFDVIEIYAPEGIKTKKPKIHHLEDAFQ